MPWILHPFESEPHSYVPYETGCHGAIRGETNLTTWMTDSLCHCDGDGSERGKLLGSDRAIITLCQVIGSPFPPTKSFLAFHADTNFAIKYHLGKY